MKLTEAITMIDALVPNSYTDEDKIRWLSNLDGTIKKNIIDKHVGGTEVTFEGYTADTPLETELLVPAPYDMSIYSYWLQAQIDYWNQELSKYNNSITMYNTAYSEFERWYIRNHMPVERKLKFF